MVEFLIEFLLETFGQLIFGWLFESGFRRLARLLSNRAVRALLGGVVAVVAGYSGGYLWGVRLTEHGRTEVPNSLWVSIGLAVIFALLALSRLLTREETDGGRTEGEALRATFTPWRWAPGRLFGFAALNAFVAVGIAVGFDPRPRR